MLVKFHTPSHGDITYEGKIGVALLKLMGRTGNVPGALDAEHVPAALAALKHELAIHQEAEHATQASAGDENADVIALRTRAFPLIELLEAAAGAGEYVSWE
jgi:hypothetical protein